MKNDLITAQNLGFSSLDFLQIKEHGISIESIQKQMDIFKARISKSILVAPASLSNGILKLSETDFQKKAAFYDDHKANLKLTKFVPASGAASRMFKFLNEFLIGFDIEKESINAYINRNKESELTLFINRIDKFPFFEAVDKKLREVFPNYDFLEEDYKNYYFIKLLLESDSFDFANKPKGILPFHKYETHVGTAIEEHMRECASYSSSATTSHLHFTVSEAHQSQFESIVSGLKTEVEKKSGTTLNISYSYQNKSTDTLAVDLDNNPFRNENGELVFRPGGHGALIENLNDLDADVVFIKNIDNVIQNNIAEIALYKKSLAGIALELQQQVFGYLNAIDSNEINEENIGEIIVFLKEKLNIEVSPEFDRFTFENKIVTIKEHIDRPIRVCGMVKNEGEPGGGPFWTKQENGSVSLQIVESSQVDLTDINQVKILGSATHFNPVDLVCCIKNHKGRKFNLTQFIDHNSGFIVEKNVGKKNVKAYELPGLWNGAMANWLTVFVEVPLLTFNPVKTVNDLLKPAHQPK